MCGIFGFIDGQRALPNGMAVLRQATLAMAPRGPDAEAHWNQGPVFLGHRRLAILDLSPAGLQPMKSANGRYVLIFNGELYNHAELRKALPGHAWRGHSDTEVLLEHLARFGVADTLAKSRGMFAFALWDEQTRQLSLARDRFGEKPLFYGFHQGVFVFGSELKSLRAFPVRPSISASAVGEYLQYGYISAPQTIYEGIYKVLPGHWLSAQLAPSGALTLKPVVAYWSPESGAHVGRQRYGGLAGTAQVDTLEGLLQSAVAEQLMADVPVGALLSGGIDSSLVAALAQKASARPLQTFTIGFADPRYDEAPYARAVAHALGTQHHELIIGDQDLLALATQMPSVYDEPFADSSQIPILLVARMVAQRVPVCLSGDGGDELFKGYERYLSGKRLWGALQWMPGAVRSTLARHIGRRSPEAWDAALGRIARAGVTGDRLHKAAGLLAARTLHQFYDGLACLPGGRQLVCEPVAKPFPAAASCTPNVDLIDWGSRWDLQHYLPDDILVKVDRAAMSQSLETRVPLLDARVAEFSLSLPTATHVQGRTGKQLLRAVLARHLPMALFERPKKGFSVPLDAWLRGPLKEWATAQLFGNRGLATCGVLNTKVLAQQWAEHQAGQRNWSQSLWAAVVLGAFLAQH